MIIKILCIFGIFWITPGFISAAVHREFIPMAIFVLIGAALSTLFQNTKISTNRNP